MQTEDNNSIIAKVNNVPIILIEKEKLVPIKPICEALGIDSEPQRQKITEDDILSSVAMLSKATGKDEKEYKMFCLPLKYIFGWLFSINHKNVKPEAQEGVKKYKLECYDVLYSHFTEYSQFMEERQRLIDESLSNMQITKEQFRNAKNRLHEDELELNKLRRMNFHDWKASKKQMELAFPVN